MSYRSWLLIAALGLVLSPTLLEAQEEAGGTEGQAQQQQEPISQRLPVPFPVEIVEDQSEIDARQSREAEARQREIDDLEAQRGMNAATQSMNEATQSMMRAAWVSTALVGIGTVLLIGTLVLTLLANKAASRAAEAATGMNSLTKALEQPLIGISMPETGVTLDEQHWQFEREIKFKIVNMGRSPAKITAIHREWTALPSRNFPAPIDPAISVENVTKPTHRYVAGGATTEGIWSKNESLAVSNSRPELIIFHGWIRFENMIEDRFVAGFCYFIAPSNIAEADGYGFAMAWPEENTEKYNYCREDGPASHVTALPWWKRLKFW